MATPGQLVRCVAAALQLPEPTVVQYDRQLAEAGLRSKSGRGSSAAIVTAGDAANLLISILGSPVSGGAIKSAVDTCKTYGRVPLRLGGDVETLRKFKKFGLGRLSSLGPHHTLRDCITALIEGAQGGEAFVIPDEDGDPMLGPANDWFLGITLDGPGPWAEVLADASLGSLEPACVARFVYHTAKRTAAGSPKAVTAGDLHQSRHITFKTIRLIGDLLAKERQ